MYIDGFLIRLFGWHFCCIWFHQIKIRYFRTNLIFKLMTENQEITFTNRLVLLLFDPLYGSILIALPIILLILLFNWLFNLMDSSTVSSMAAYIYFAAYLNK